MILDQSPCKCVNATRSGGPDYGIGISREIIMRQGLQSFVLLALTLFQPIAGRLAPLTQRGVSIEKRSDAARGPVTPAKGAFAIWGPLFAGNLALAVRSFFGPLESRASKWIAWLSSAAFAGNIAWSLQAQFAGLGWPSFGIISGSAAAAGAATIVAESVDDDSGFARFAATAIGPLAGWLTVATVANLDSTLVETQGRLPERAASKRAAMLAGAASVVATGMVIATRGNPGYAAASAWGLGGVLLRNRRESRPVVANAAAVGLCTVGLTMLLSRCCLRR